MSTNAVIPTVTNVVSQVKKLKTEDTGKIFEKAICEVYGIDYVGPYKYEEPSENLKTRLSKLTEIFPMCRHSASKGARYDFTDVINESNHLSAKSTKGGVGKVAPQVIGQSQPQKFCDIMEIEFTSVPDLKKYIQENIKTIIPVLVSYTFDCPNIYYNKSKNTIRYITLDSQIPWNECNFKWTREFDKWNNSSTLKILKDDKAYSLVEFQFHTKSRTNMAIRWFYENFLTVFKDYITIVNF